MKAYTVPMDRSFEKKLQTSNPLDIFLEWYEEAKKTEVNDPDAMCLATVNAQGQPSARMVLFKAVDDRGFKFHTNADSQKGQEIAHNARVAICIHWKSLRKQVRVEGIVQMIDKKEADEYFASRPHKRQIGAWASNQSRPVDSREDFENRIKHFEDKFESQNIPRPDNWCGYIVAPQKMEFWFDNPDRLHDRFIVTRGDAGVWSDPVRLYP